MREIARSTRPLKIPTEFFSMLNDQLCTMFEIDMLKCNSLISAIPKRWKQILKKGRGFMVEENTNYTYYCNMTKLKSNIYKMQKKN